MANVEWIGYLAGCLTTAAFAPQALQILRTRRVEDISLAMYVSFVAGVALWVAYGVAQESIAIVVANSVTLLLAGSVLVMKIVLAGRASKG